jgi:hypothetical protein
VVTPRRIVASVTNAATADGSDALLAQARALEAQAATAGEDSSPGRTLLGQAAQLRLQALGSRSYPIATCARCFRVTGWADASGLCDSCLRRAQLEAAYRDPHGGFVQFGADKPVAPRAEPRARAGLLGLVIGGRGTRERARVETWMRRVEPDVTGPVPPEDGYELEVARRDEVEAADGSGIVIRFSTATHRFAEGAWAPLETTRIGSRDLLIPAEHSAGLAPEVLMDAWVDFRGAVDAVNEGRWSREAAAREAGRVAQAEHDELLREQRKVSELLDEN